MKPKDPIIKPKKDHWKYQMEFGQKESLSRILNRNFKTYVLKNPIVLMAGTMITLSVCLRTMNWLTDEKDLSQVLLRNKELSRYERDWGKSGIVEAIDSEGDEGFDFLLEKRFMDDENPMLNQIFGNQQVSLVNIKRFELQGHRAGKDSFHQDWRGRYDAFMDIKRAKFSAR